MEQAILSCPRSLLLRGLESNQHRRDQSPLSCQLDDPRIGVVRDHKRKERESNPQGSSLGRFRDGCHRQLACPSVVSCGGRNRTCNRLLNREPPYHWATPQKSGRLGCKPTLSASRNRRIPRLSHVLSKSTQRESNPHVLHGEQAGCRYITGARQFFRKWDPRDSNPHHAG